MVRWWGLSAVCAAEACDVETCDTPDQCDHDCHLEDPPDDQGPTYDQDFPGGW